MVHTKRNTRHDASPLHTADAERLTVLIQADARPGMQEQLLAAFASLAGRRKAQDGFVRYDLYRDAEHSGRLVAHETWESEEAMDQAIGEELDVLLVLFEQLEALTVRPLKVTHWVMLAGGAYRPNSERAKCYFETSRIDPAWSATKRALHIQHS